MMQIQMAGPGLYGNFIVALIILTLGLVGGLLPILARTDGKIARCLNCSESFAGGIFLGVGLIHLLPEAQTNLQLVSHYSYPFVCVIVAFTILFFRVIEETSSKIFQVSEASQLTWIAYILTLMLSIHSFVEGAALGVEIVWSSFIMIFIAIISHKFSAAFALGVKMRRASITKSKKIQLITLFALMTPIGILLGSLLIIFFAENPGHIFQGIFNAVAAGTFLYIAAFHACSGDHNHDGCRNFSQLICFSIGVILMAVIAIWL